MSAPNLRDVRPAATESAGSRPRIRPFHALRKPWLAAPLAALLGIGMVLLPSVESASAAPQPLSDAQLAYEGSTASTVSTTVFDKCEGDLTSNPGCGKAAELKYGEGQQIRLTGFTAGGNQYRLYPTDPDDVYTEIARKDNDTVQGVTESIFLLNAPKREGDPAGAERLRYLASDVTGRSMGDVLASPYLSEGSDNTFTNTKSDLTRNNVERVSVLRRTPVQTSDPARVGVSVQERGGNDNFKIAAITAVDGDGNPTVWGPLITVSKDAWGTVLDPTPSTVLQQRPGDDTYRPLTTTGAQRIAGVYVSLEDLGIGAGQNVYGISVLATDENSPNGDFNNQTNGNDGGLDMVGAVFATSLNPTAEPAENTDKQGNTQVLTLEYAAGDSIAPIDEDRTVLTPPDNGSVSDDGLTVTVPGEGVYTLNRADGTVTFVPEENFVGKATPIGYRVYDTQGAAASSTITPTVVPNPAKPDETTGPQGKEQRVNPLENDDSGAELDPASLTLVDADGNEVQTITIDGQGTYTVENGEIVFQPEPQFTGTADPVTYRATAGDGTDAESTYTPHVDPVTPTANPDTTSGPRGAQQSIDPLANDEAGSDDVPLDPSSLTLLDADGNPTDTVTVDGEGTYTLEEGKLVFTPLDDFVGEATPVNYRVADENGTTTQSTYTPTVTDTRPKANPDTTSGPQGQEQRSSVLDNDDPVDDQTPLDPATLTLLDADGNPVDTLTVDGEGTYTVDGGEIVFQPVADFVGEATPVNYRVADTNGAETESTYTPTVTSVDPTARPDKTDGPQGEQQRVDPLKNDSPGADGVPLDPSSLTLLDADGNPTDSVTVDGEGTYTIENGEIVFTPVPEFTGEATPVGYQVADENGTTAQSTYTPTVRPANPKANPDETSGPQGEPQSVDPLENDEAAYEGPPLDPSTLTLLDANGEPTDSVKIDGQGTYTIENGRIVFTPLPEFSGQATPVDYRVADENGTTTESTYTPTVDPDPAPEAVPDETSGPKGQPQSVDPLDNDKTSEAGTPLDPASLTLLDADGNPVDSVTVDGQGTYTIEDGRIVFTPEPDFVGTATPVHYRISDTDGQSAESTYTPTVEDGPKAVNDTSSGPQGQPQSVDPLANDEPGEGGSPLDPASLTLLDADGNPTDSVEVPGQGTYTIEDGKIVFTPVPEFTGTADPVTYRVADEDGNTATAKYTPTVNPADAPKTTDDTSSGPQGQPQSVDPLANDEPGEGGSPLDPASLTLLDADGNPTDSVEVPGQGTYTIEDGKIVFTPVPEFTGTADPVTYRVADEDGNTATAKYTPTVNPADAPKTTDDTSSGPQGQPQSVDPLANDEPGEGGSPLDPASLTLLDADGNPTDSVEVPGQGTYTIEDGKIVFTPVPEFTGTADPVTYRVADEDGNTATAKYTPTVNPADAPKTTDDTSSGPQGQPQSVDPLANDEPGEGGSPLDPASLTLLDADGNPTDSVEVPGQGTYTIEDGKIVFTPLSDFTGEADPVTYRVADENGNTATATYTPTLEPDDEDPSVRQPETASDSATTSSNSPVTINVLENDEPGSSPLDPSSVKFVPRGDEPDGTQFSDDGKTVTIPGQGTFTVSDDGVVTFTPEQGFVGTVTPIDYTVTGEDGATSEPTQISVIVNSADGPKAVNDKTSGPQGRPQSVDPLANDEPGESGSPLDPASLTLLDENGDPTDSVEVPGQGTYTIEDGKIVFTPLSDFTGEADPVTYRVADRNGNTATATYTPTLEPDDEDPSVRQPETASDSATTSSNTPVTINVLENDEPGSSPLDPSSVKFVPRGDEPDGTQFSDDGKTVTIPGQGTFTVSDDGVVTFTPEQGFVGTVTPIDYTVTGEDGATSEPTQISVIVNSADGPKAVNDKTSGPQGRPQSVDPLANDEPGEGGSPLDPASLTLLDADGNPTDSVEVPGQGTYTIEDGKIVFTPLSDFTGEADPVTYRVADENGNTATATYTPTLEPDDEDPSVRQPETASDSATTSSNSPVTINVLENDEPGSSPLDPSSVKFVPRGDEPDGTQFSDDGKTVTIPGQGTFTVSDDGVVTFTPEQGFVGTVTPIDYTVTGEDGATSEPTQISVIVNSADGPKAVNDKTSGPQGRPQSVDPLANDEPGEGGSPLDPASLTLLDADGNPTDSVEVPGQGTYTIEDGKIVFTPLSDFVGEATPVTYRVADEAGNTATATYTPTVTEGDDVDPSVRQPETTPDNAETTTGTPVVIDVLKNDKPGSSPIDPSTVKFVPRGDEPEGTEFSDDGKRVTIPNVGTFEVGNDGKVTFTPVPNFSGKVPTLSYTVTGEDGGVSSPTDINVTVVEKSPSPEPTDPGTAEPTDPGTPEPTDPGTPGPTDPGTPGPADPGKPSLPPTGADLSAAGGIAALAALLLGLGGLMLWRGRRRA